jgi:inhibitor of cysteine peptidase
MNIKKYIGVFAILIISFIIGNNVYACSINGTSVISMGSKSTKVSDLQACLIENGYDIGGTPTGYYGSLTTTAVKNFYKDTLKMAWDGKSIGPKGLTALKNTKLTSSSSTPTNYRYVKNADDFKKYLENQNNYYGIGLGGGPLSSVATTVTAPMASESSAKMTNVSVSDSNRVSQTNVQVAGIDEPDIVKTDGKNLYMAKPTYWYGWGGDPMPFVKMSEPAVDTKMAIMPPYEPVIPKTQVISIDPVVDMAIQSEKIDASGEMLYVKDSKTLVVFSNQNIVGYNVADPKNPSKIWTMKLDDSTYRISARLKDDTLYMVTSTYVNGSEPCPFVPLLDVAGNKMMIPCNRILVPETISPVNQLYTAMKINTKNGSVIANTTIAENGYGATVAMFEDNLYLATEQSGEYTRIYNQIYVDTASKFISGTALAKITKIQGYDISDNGKQSEIQQVVETDINRLSKDEQMKTRNDMQNKIQDELNRRARELYRTKITRMSLNDMSIAKTASIPGRLVNQFALDEYKDTLRVATTVGESWGGKSANDVYVLDMNLNVLGSIKDLGLTERIYSVRFMGDVGYLVTFRQTDPFYVLDLKDTTNPKVAGELKIPGYSSYLEDLGNGQVLGIGREAGNLKLSLFDVTDPKNPKELDKNLLKNNWSEAENNHHAFLHDAEHKAFFIPGNDGGYIFSYAGGKIVLVKTVAGNNTKRAIYIGDNLYVIADTKITVVNEKTWTTVKEWEIK